jgi:hypothetical protein
VPLIGKSRFLAALEMTKGAEQFKGLSKVKSWVMIGTIASK